MNNDDSSFHHKNKNFNYSNIMKNEKPINKIDVHKLTSKKDYCDSE